MSKAQELQNLKKQCEICTMCDIGGIMIDKEYLSNVFSNMCVKAQIMVVGQNPGYQEVKNRIPFIGEAGQFFNSALRDVLGIDRSNLYITNCCHCYTMGNRSPHANELSNCQYFLENEIKIVQPKLVITLGNPAMRVLTGMDGITKHHGKIINSLRYGVPVLPLYHPSPFNMNKKEMRDEFYKDLKVAKEFITNG